MVESFWFVFKMFFLDPKVILPAISIGCIIFIICILWPGNNDSEPGEDSVD